MSEAAIRVENLSKLYQIGAAQERPDMLRDWLTTIFRHGSHDARDEKLWALKDVSFEVRRGEVVGVIGRNGAGKSTLLKILSRITEPTSGRVEMEGRVGSLLEVGTGFHPELTGRENVFLSGAILGMRRHEIEQRFDEIVDFSGVEKFIDTPIKRYSSGMKVRLGFAVAAHLEPEILLIDEVLSVGDMAFQKKCLGKMSEVAGEGRTVIFVSHNMAAVRSLCDCGILIADGQKAFEGTATDTVSAYIGQMGRIGSLDLSSRNTGVNDSNIRLIGIDISDGKKDAGGELVTGGSALFTFRVNRLLRRLSCKFTIYDAIGRHVAFFDSYYRSPNDQVDKEEHDSIDCYVAELPLVPGKYRINAQLDLNGEKIDHVEGAAFFVVREGLMGGRRVVFSNVVNVTIPHSWILPKELQ